MDDFSLARPAGHLIMGDGSGPDGLATKDGAKALSGAASVDTATTQVDKPSRTKNLITEFQAPGFYQKHGYEVFAVLEDHPAIVAIIICGNGSSKWQGLGLQCLYTVLS